MSKHLIPVEGHSGLARDKRSGAIVNINSTEITQARMRKQKRQQEKQEMEQFRSDIDQIKRTLAALLERLEK
jgi:hypothetical protein